MCFVLHGSTGQGRKGRDGAARSSKEAQRSGLTVGWRPDGAATPLSSCTAHRRCTAWYRAFLQHWYRRRPPPGPPAASTPAQNSPPHPPHPRRCRRCRSLPSLLPAPRSLVPPAVAATPPLAAAQAAARAPGGPAAGRAGSAAAQPLWPASLPSAWPAAGCTRGDGKGRWPGRQVGTGEACTAADRQGARSSPTSPSALGKRCLRAGSTSPRQGAPTLNVIPRGSYPPERQILLHTFLLLNHQPITLRLHSTAQHSSAQHAWQVGPSWRATACTPWLPAMARRDGEAAPPDIATAARRSLHQRQPAAALRPPCHARPKGANRPRAAARAPPAAAGPFPFGTGGRSGPSAPRAPHPPPCAGRPRARVRVCVCVCGVVAAARRLAGYTRAARQPQPRARAPNLASRACCCARMLSAQGGAQRGAPHLSRLSSMEYSRWNSEWSVSGAPCVRWRGRRRAEGGVRRPCVSARRQRHEAAAAAATAWSRCRPAGACAVPVPRPVQWYHSPCSGTARVPPHLDHVLGHRRLQLLIHHQDGHACGGAGHPGRKAGAGQRASQPTPCAAAGRGASAREDGPQGMAIP